MSESLDKRLSRLEQTIAPPGAELIEIHVHYTPCAGLAGLRAERGVVDVDRETTAAAVIVVDPHARRVIETRGRL